jgi:hypothetical protein
MKPAAKKPARVSSFQPAKLQLAVTDRAELPESLPDLAKRIRVEHASACAAVRKGIEHAMAAGEMLTRAKLLCDHGQWLPWLEKHCPEVSVRQAQKYMLVASHRDQLANAPSGAHLGINEALAALSNAPPGAHLKLSNAPPGAHLGICPPQKFALPREFRDLALGSDVPCPAPVREKLAAAGVATANDFYSRFKAKDLCGLDEKEAEQIRLSLQSRCLAAAAAAAERDGPSKLLAFTYKRWLSPFGKECVDKVQAWWIQNKRTPGTKPFFTAGVAPTDVEAPVYYALLLQCEEMIRGSKEGPSLLDGLAPPAPLEDMVSEAIIDLGKGAKPAAVREHIRAKHGDHYEDTTIEECMSTLGNTPPTLGNKPVKSKPKASGCPSPELALSALARLRLDQKLAKVRDFPPQVAGALSLQGIRTVRDLLKDSQDLATQVVRVLESAGHVTQAARCIKAVRKYLGQSEAA